MNERLSVLTSTNWGKFGVESRGQTGSLSGTHEEVSLVTDVLDPGVDIEVCGDEGGVGWLLRLAACCRP